MKLLLFSDVHMNRNYCDRLVEMSATADLVIGAGDFCSLRMGIGNVIGWLSEIEKPAILVPGNAESFDELKKAAQKWPSAKVLHGNGMEWEGFSIFGIGGGIPVTPFGPWSYDFSEMEAENLLKDCPENAVLLSHSPPWGIVDVSSAGKHLGSKTVRKTIEEKVPKLVVCGHIHESAGQMDRLGSTVIINAGPEGMYYDIE